MLARRSAENPEFYACVEAPCRQAQNKNTVMARQGARKNPTLGAFTK